MIQIAQIHLTQLVFNIDQISLPNALLCAEEDRLLFFASCLAKMNCCDSGRQARTMAASTENPAPIKYRALQEDETLGTTPFY
jgi:hypothetical protein